MSLFESASLVVTPNGTKASKLYAIKPTDGSGDLTVTRATSATRVNASGVIETVGANVPRLDYSNGSCPSILVEPQRTNITLQSQDLSVTWYTANGLLTANDTTAPDGTTTADKIKADTTNGIHVYQQTINVSNGTIYTMSVFVKSSEYTFFELADASSLKGQAFNLTAKTISAPQTGGFSPATSSKIEDYGNGWLRCSITYTTSSTTAFFRMSLSNGTTTSFTGNNTSGLFVWGAQLEAGSYATLYIPTTTASVTRNADVISKTGISSLIGQTEGTVYLECEADITNSNGAILVYLGSSDGSGAFDYSTYIKFNSNNLNLTVYSGGVLYVNSNSTETYTNKQKIKVAFCYKNNDFICYANGIQLFTDTLGTVSTNLSSIALGHYPPNIPFNQYNGSFKNINVWKTRLTNAQLAELTTI